MAINEAPREQGQPDGEAGKVVSYAEGLLTNPQVVGGLSITQYHLLNYRRDELIGIEMSPPAGLARKQNPLITSALAYINQYGQDPITIRGLENDGTAAFLIPHQRELQAKIETGEPISEKDSPIVTEAATYLAKCKLAQSLGLTIEALLSLERRGINPTINLDDSPSEEEAEMLLERDFMGRRILGFTARAFDTSDIKWRFTQEDPPPLPTKGDIIAAREKEALVYIPKGIVIGGLELPITLNLLATILRHYPHPYVKKGADLPTHEAALYPDPSAGTWFFISKAMLEDSIGQTEAKQRQVLGDHEDELRARGALNASVHLPSALQIGLASFIAFVGQQRTLFRGPSRIAGFKDEPLAFHGARGIGIKISPLPNNDQLGLYAVR